MTKRKMLLTLLDEFAGIERGDMLDSHKLAMQFGIDIAAHALIGGRRVTLAQSWRNACRMVIRNSGHVGQTTIDIINGGN